jgi:hypothetical protein
MHVVPLRRSVPGVVRINPTKHEVRDTLCGSYNVSALYAPFLWYNHNPVNLYQRNMFRMGFKHVPHVTHVLIIATSIFVKVQPYVTHTLWLTYNRNTQQFGRKRLIPIQEILLWAGVPFLQTNAYYMSQQTQKKKRM